MIETGDNIVVRLAGLAEHLSGGARSPAPRCSFAGLEEDWTAARWHLDLRKAVRACDARTKAIFICLAGQSDRLDHVARRAASDARFRRARGIAIISDEVYGTLVL